MSPTVVHNAMKKITSAIDFRKKVSIHTRRRSYATHLFEAGCSSRRIQEYLGYLSLQTTMKSKPLFVEILVRETNLGAAVRTQS